jgi:hypothetical protein
MTEGKNFKKRGRWQDGWWVKVRHQHRTTDVPNMIWLSDEFFELSENDQFAEIEKIKLSTYDPVDSGGGYMAAWFFCLNKVTLMQFPAKNRQNY